MQEQNATLTFHVVTIIRLPYLVLLGNENKLDYLSYIHLPNIIKNNQVPSLKEEIFDSLSLADYYPCYKFLEVLVFLSL